MQYCENKYKYSNIYMYVCINKYGSKHLERSACITTKQLT
jgi:hypothetical protein